MKRNTANRFGSVRWMIAATAAMAILSTAAARAAVEREEVSTKTVPVQGESVILITNARGDVKVVGQQGRSDISIEVRKIVRARGDEEAARLFGLMELEVVHAGKEIKARAVYPEERERERSIIGYILQHYPSVRMDLNLTVPAGLNVRTVTSSGDVELSDIGGAVEVNSASGDAEIADVAGTVKVGVASGDVSIARVGGDASVTSSNGDIEAEDIKGNALIQSASGEIVVSRIGGNLTAASTSGDVTVHGVSAVEYSGTSGSATLTGVRGPVTAAVTSGDIEVSAAPEAPTNYELRTSSGEIVLRFEKILPGGFVLKARTTSGDISVRLPIQISKVGRHDLAGVVRAGTSVVIIETASGDITIAEPEE
jgi:DUF4097 and DUF4098 domain-containing protein YvlB